MIIRTRARACLRPRSGGSLPSMYRGLAVLQTIVVHHHHLHVRRAQRRFSLRAKPTSIGGASSLIETSRFSGDNTNKSGDNWNRLLKVVSSQKTTYTDQSLKEVDHIWTTMVNMFGAEPSRERLHKLCQLWVAGTTEGRAPELQDIFLRKKDVFIHILINTRSYQVYTNYVEPLYRDGERRMERTWADEVITTLQFQNDENGLLVFNENAIRSFLASSSSTTTHSIESKSKLLTIFIRKGLLYSTDHNERLTLINHFLRFLRIIHHDHCLFIDNEYRNYWKAVAEMATPPVDVIAYDYAHELRKVFSQVFGDEESRFNNFLTLAMNAVRSYSPANTLSYWDYKLESVYEEDLNTNNLGNVFHHRDLTNAMKALRAQNLHKEVFKLHNNFPELHHDEQIDVLLYTCEDAKDWMMLQDHFERMYGKGDLPLPIHYAIVMNALAGIGATADVERLFSQLLKRNLMPNSYVYAALIKCRLNDDQIDDAIKIAESYFSLLDKGKVSDKPTTYLYNLILKAYTRSSDLGKAMSFLERVVVQQQTMKTKLISYSLLGDIVRFASKNLGINEIIKVKQIAVALQADGIPFRLQLIKAYTALGFYQKADEEITTAHQISDIPFSLPHVCAVQVRNCFFWYQRAQSTERKRLLVNNIKFIVARLYDGTLANSGKGHLIAELIRYYVYRGPLANATSLLELAKRLEVVHEKHYLPLLKHYSSQDEMESQQQVLALYKDMAVNRINAGAKTYVSLMKALNYLDGRVGNFDRSQELLRTIFDTYGLSVNSPTVKDAVSFDSVFNDASELCSIVSLYVMSRQPSPNEVLFNFLEQMKQILKDKITNDFRYLVALDMAQLYYQQGNISFAITLAKNTVGEMNEVFDKYWHSYCVSGLPMSDFRYPKQLTQIYQKLTKLLFANTSDEEIESYYHEAEQHHALLLGTQYNSVMRCLLDKGGLKEALEISERHLISGNLVERKLYERLQYYWKLFILHQFQAKGVPATLTEYAILNEFYDIRDPKELMSELRHIKEPLEALQKFIDKEGVPYKKSLKITGLLKLIRQVFNPEYRIFSDKKIHQHIINQLRKALNQYIGKDTNKAFQLMDDYESTLMFLIEEKGMGTKMWKFRKEINQILKPQGGTHETLVQRRKRTIEALTLAHNNSQNKTFL